ncbi:MAG: flagellar hook-length control protein FliK [Nitrospirae bacterium]|nr:flagellar hook-length control protein FliK [Nitrospirota bacterium]
MELIVTMDIGRPIPPADRSAAPPSSSVSVERRPVTKPAHDKTFSALFGGFVHNSPVEEVSSDIGLPIHPASCSAAPVSLSASVERGQVTQSAQGKTIPALVKGLAPDVPDEEAVSPSKSEDATVPAPSADAEKQATIVPVVVGSLVSNSAVEDSQVASSAEADRTESAQNVQRSSPPAIESSLLVLQNVSVAETHEAGVTGQASAETETAPPTTSDLPSHPALRPSVDPGQTGESPAMTPKQTVSRTADESPIQNGRGASVDRAPVPVEQLSGNLVFPGTPPPNSLISDQLPSPVMENQGARNVLLAAFVNGGVQSLDQLSTGAQPSAKVQAQGTQETTLLGQSLPVPVIGESGEGGGDLFGADAEGRGEGIFFHSRENGALESATRGNQPASFNGQFMSAQQAQSSSAGSSVVTPTEDRLKMAQAFLGEDHSATVASASGKVQTVHVELPFHDSGPLSVRISMTDQMVHTQFTTDRNDLGALLFTRQDQLQQSLAKSGLELGQFQVHIDQRSQQEALPDRQPRRNGEELEQQPASQDHNRQAQDRERPDHRPPRALSLFA